MAVSRVIQARPRRSVMGRLARGVRGRLDEFVQRGQLGPTRELESREFAIGRWP